MKFFTIVLLALVLGAFGSIGAVAQSKPAPPIEVPGLQGAWYDPGNPGYGVFIDDSVDGVFVAWFTYDFRYFEQGQAWYVGNRDKNARWNGDYQMVRPTGSFLAQGYEAGAPVATLSIDRLDIDKILITWKFFQEEPCVTPRVSPSPPECEGEAILTRFYPAD